jgi:hypothetical protein
MSKHTPGPWRILEIEPWNDSGAMWFKAPEGHDGIKSSGDDERHIEIRSTTDHMHDLFGSSEGGHIASVPMTYDGRGQALANARKLAAAPDMYEALANLVDAVSVARCASEAFLALGEDATDAEIERLATAAEDANVGLVIRENEARAALAKARPE